MFFFKPDLRLASQLPEQTFLEDKYGGIPWGLPEDRWPLCRDCGKPQSLLAQLSHDPERLDLGQEGRVLFLFQCTWNPGECSTWDGNSGANACFTLNSHELLNRLTECPSSDIYSEIEVRVREWIRVNENLEQLLSIEPFKESATLYTKLGGLPYFIQNPNEAPGEPYRFVGQIDWLHHFYCELPSANEVGCSVMKRDGRRTREQKPDREKANAPPFIEEMRSDCSYRWYCSGPNVGTGTGYIYLKNVGDEITGYFFW